MLGGRDVLSVAPTGSGKSISLLGAGRRRGRADDGGFAASSH